MTITFNRQTLPFRTDFLIAGTQGRLSTNSYDILQAAAQGRSLTSQTGSPLFEMEVIVDSALDDAPEHAAYFRGLRHLVFGFLPPRSFVTYDLLRRRAHAVLSIAAARDTSFWNALLLPITIGVLGTTFGVVPLHCACLDRNGAGFLVAGLSGAGKSTLATAIAQRGFALVSDDWTYVSKQKSALVAHGLFSPIKLLPDAVRFFPDLHKFAPRTTLNGEMAYEIAPGHSFGFEMKKFTHPGHIFFLQRVSTPGCHFVPCRPEEVVDFFEKSAERLPSELNEAKVFRTTIIQILSACPSWILRTGENPHGTAAAIDHFLSGADRAPA